MGLGEVIGKAVDAYNGNSSGTTLEDFLTKFTPSGGAFVNTIDPLNTFEVTFTFFPEKPKETAETDPGKAALESLKQSGIQALNNLANNMTAGIAGAIANAKNPGILDAHKKHTPGKETFMNYLADACLLINADNVIGSTPSKPLQLSLGFYIQSITIPQLKQEDNGTSETLFGKFPVPGRFVMPDNNILTMNVINTKLPLMEMIFYPWMREVTLPFWSYESQPYTTATIEVDMTKHSEVKYKFYGCRPTQIQTMTPTQEPDTVISRDINFAFDSMYISSSYKTSESVADKLLGAAAGLAGAAASMTRM